MKAIIQAYLPINGVSGITVQSVGPTPTKYDRFTICDKYGSQVQMDVAVLHLSLQALAKSRDMDILQYLSKVQLGDINNVDG
jgi:hypothetical protein